MHLYQWLIKQQAICELKWQILFFVYHTAMKPDLQARRLAVKHGCYFLCSNRSSYQEIVNINVFLKFYYNN